MTKNTVLPREPSAPKRKPSYKNTLTLGSALLSLLVAITTLVTTSQKITMLKNAEHTQLEQVKHSQSALQTQLEARLQQSELNLEQLVKQSSQVSALQAQSNAEQLINMAQLQLQFGANISAAIRLLTAAAQQIKPYDTTAINPLKQAIIEDIDTLNNMTTTDQQQVLTTIDALITHVNDIVTMHAIPTSNSSTPDSNHDSNASNWKKRIQANLNTLKSLVIIRRTDDDTNFLLTPNQILLNKQLAIAKLIQAQWGALESNNTVFNHNLLAAKQAIEKLDFPAEEKMKLLTQIKQLLTTPLRNNMNITLSAYTKLQGSNGE